MQYFAPRDECDRPTILRITYGDLTPPPGRLNPTNWAGLLRGWVGGGVCGRAWGCAWRSIPPRIPMGINSISPRIQYSSIAITESAMLRRLGSYLSAHGRSETGVRYLPDRRWKARMWSLMGCSAPSTSPRAAALRTDSHLPGEMYNAVNQKYQR